MFVLTHTHAHAYLHPVIGIIDYMRHYDIFKKIEFRAKNQFEEATIQPPLRYGDRFRRAMDRYFMDIPSHIVPSPLHLRGVGGATEVGGGRRGEDEGRQEEGGQEGQQEKEKEKDDVETKS